jgi:adenosylcobyric acid synthase
MAKSLMVQGTGSHVGKSVIVAALCRILANRGYRVAPFKSQNMALNSFITPEGGEIGRAQAYQAEAARVSPSVLMNPVLLKANSDTGAQVIVKGRVVGNMGVREYHAYKDEAFRAVRESYDELASKYDVIVIEGAGSPAEINLKSNDIVNMMTAKMAGAKVLIAADIDKGGVFAQIVGTMELLDESEREIVGGFIINKFRGDPTLLDDGLDFIRERTGRPVMGVIPYFTDIYVQEEDGVALADAGNAAGVMHDGGIDVAVVRLAHISNFTDFDALAREPGVRVRYVRDAAGLGEPDLLILPGSKNTIGDLLGIRRNGLERAIRGYHARGGRVTGICGGFQMLGHAIRDPHGVETDQAVCDGMGLLDADTTLEEEKVTRQVTAMSADGAYNGLAGYEIHMGRTTLGPGASSMFRVDSEHDDGATSRDGRAWGTYIHGIFDNDEFRKGILSAIGYAQGESGGLSYSEMKDEALDRLAEHVENSIDMEGVMRMIGL